MISTSFTKAEARMAAALAKRSSAGTLRTARQVDPKDAMIDFSSNDYLSIARNKELYQAHLEEEVALLKKCESTQLSGSTGSRLLSGCSLMHDKLEIWAARFHGWERTVLFGSGYAANSAVAACIATHDDAILYDELCHNCTRFGFKNGRQKITQPFNHNCISELSKAIKSLRSSAQQVNTIFIFIESIYSMDGDAAPLIEFAQICRSDGNACLIIDEAHSTGILGTQGRGVTSTFDISDVVLCCVYTFGKALGCHGALVASSETVANYLENYAQPLIYATAPAPAASRLALCCYQAVASDHGDLARAQLDRVILTLRQALTDVLQHLPPTSSIRLLPSDSPIHALLVPGATRVVSLATCLQDSGFDVRPIRAPTVKPGTERIRIVAHAHNTTEEALALVAAIKHALLNNTSYF